MHHSASQSIAIMAQATYGFTVSGIVWCSARWTSMQQAFWHALNHAERPLLACGAQRRFEAQITSALLRCSETADLDIAFNWSRHVTVVKCEQLITEILDNQDSDQCTASDAASAPVVDLVVSVHVATDAAHFSLCDLPARCSFRALRRTFC